ncbi:Electron transport complex subunit RsxB [Pseudodesulfovibrio hydrargyri]|uniref:Electron transport complex subunit RsxB n=1 Tax=Pseudodesulfovibrio hydrargyri TaxID=2125990 RepID=A0A1J5MTL4_9BACT|nr:ATP-binding protein [Pseudodesulfovibrio hydrargyri]OIQ49965.1 Electron transport complex subunit RsxB [Pseudodesulfovibrio hydrargyri]
MIYAVASGKGGTGKTTVSSSLAALWDGPATLVDLDVEEPNLHLFLKPELTDVGKAWIEVPEADESKCTRCRACADICQFKAITVMADTLLVFADMCHGCGGCLAVCPEGALFPGRRELGEICRGTAGRHDFVMGRLRVGEAMSPPLMRQVRRLFPEFSEKGDILIDAPPGVSCPAIAAVTDADCIVLVTEPTPFGFHDFKLAWEAFTPLGKPMGAVINRADLGDTAVRDFCRENDIPVWAEIPYSREVAEAYSRGEVVAEALKELEGTFTGLREHMRAAVAGGDPCAR